MYDAANQSAIDELTGASHLPLSVDLGFYFPLLSPVSLIGIAIVGADDSYSVGSNSISIIQTGIYASWLHTFASEALGGFFVRGDLGLARLGQTVSILGFSADGVSSFGFGANAGLGYGFKIGQKNKMTFSSNYEYRRVESTNNSLIALDVGFLF